MLDIGIEIIERPIPDLEHSAAGAVLLAGQWTMIKARKYVLSAGDYHWAYSILHTDSPAVLLRSDSEVSDGAEMSNTLHREEPSARRAGFTRIFFEPANEPNNLWDWSLERWRQEGPGRIAQWSSARSAFPNVKLVSPPMMPNSEPVLRPWHLPEFGQFDYLGQHTYYEGPPGSAFWSPWQLGHILSGRQLVTELNKTNSENRLVDNIAMLDLMAQWEEVAGVVFFCAPTESGNWRDYWVTEEEAAAYGEWFTNHREERKMGWQDKVAEEYMALQNEFIAEGETAEAFEAIFGLWVADGGDPAESYRRYLVGTRRKKATQSEIERMSRSGQAGFKEIFDAVSPYLPLA